MKIYKKILNENLINELRSGGIGVLATDTIYGLVTIAHNSDSVERLYGVKSRNTKKPFIILVSSISDLEKFSILLTKNQRKVLGEYWPGPNTFIFKCSDAGFRYLTRNSGSLAFRLPSNGDLLSLIQKVGPLVAPSANPEGEVPAETIDDAINYFLDEVDFYVDSGLVKGKASSIYKFNHGQLDQVR